MTQELHLTPRPDQMSDAAQSHFTTLCHPAQCHAWLHYGMLCHAVLWRAVLCYAVPRHAVLSCAVQIPQGYPAGPGEHAPWQ